MSSGFISGGTTEQPAQRNQLWIKAEEELEAARARAREQKTHEGKSLYEVLQANKAAKQEAFEESAKLKNQFRSLDEDDVEFLNSIRDNDRTKQETIQKETSDQLKAFRRLQKQQENVEDSNLPQEGGSKVRLLTDNEAFHWRSAAKKRKRAKDDKGLKGVKVLKDTSTDVKPARINPSPAAEPKEDIGAKSAPSIGGKSNEAPTCGVDPLTKSPFNASDRTPGQSTVVVTPNLGLAGYSSDDEE